MDSTVPCQCQVLLKIDGHKRIPITLLGCVGIPCTCRYCMRPCYVHYAESLKLMVYTYYAYYNNCYTDIVVFVFAN